MRLLAFLIGFSLSGLAAAGDGGGQLTKVQGQVWLRPQGGAEGTAANGAAVKLGTQIRTGNDGLAELRFEDGSLLRVQSNSSLLLSANKRQKPKTSVLLFFGRVWNKVAKSVNGDSHYEVSTPNAVAGVRGTEFETAVADDGSIKVSVSEGKVAVDSDTTDQEVNGGQEVEGDESGVKAPQTDQDDKWEEWQKKKKERLRTGSEGIVKSIKGKILSRKDKVETLRTKQKEIEQKRKGAESRAKAGDEAAINELRKLNQELGQIADEIAELGDEAQCQFGVVDHFADLASDPKFKMINRKYLEAEAASLRRIKAMFDQMVQEGTDISAEAMNKMLEDMSNGKRGTLKDKKGSSVKDLFGDDEMK